MMRSSKVGATLMSALMCAWSTPVHAAAPSADPKEVAFVESLTREAMKDKEHGAQLADFMDYAKLDARTIVVRRIVLPTPGSVQQYAERGSEEQPSDTLFDSAQRADALLREARRMVAEAQAQVQPGDKPREHVAETSAKVLDMLIDAHNDIRSEVHKRLNASRWKVDRLVAIALIVNAQNLGAMGVGPGGGPLLEACKIRSERKGVLDSRDVQFGRLVSQAVQREIPLSVYGVSLYDQAQKEMEEIPVMVRDRLKQLDEAQEALDALVKDEKRYHKAMKGAAGAEGTSTVLQTALDGVGSHLATSDRMARRLVGFLKAEGRAIRDVAECAQKTYRAAIALTQDIPLAAQLAAGNEALDSNVKAARGVGPMARRWRYELAMLGSHALDEMILPLEYKDVSAVKEHESKSGDGKKAREAVARELPKVTPAAAE